MFHEGTGWGTSKRDGMLLMERGALHGTSLAYQAFPHSAPVCFCLCRSTKVLRVSGAASVTAQMVKPLASQP